MFVLSLAASARCERVWVKSAGCWFGCVRHLFSWENFIVSNPLYGNEIEFNEYLKCILYLCLCNTLSFHLSKRATSFAVLASSSNVCFETTESAHIKILYCSATCVFSFWIGKTQFTLLLLLMQIAVRLVFFLIFGVRLKHFFVDPYAIIVIVVLHIVY